MNTSKTISLTIAGLVAIAILLLVIKILVRKMKYKSEVDGRFRTSHGIWFASLFISASLLIAKAISILSESVDNILKMNITNPISEIFKASSIFIGLTAFWFVIWYLAANMLSPVVTGKRAGSVEMEIDNFVYFLIKGVIIIGFTISLLPIFESLLRVFIPATQLPFYH